MEHLVKLITIQTTSHDEMWKVAEKIHGQLAGNSDYVDCAICLNTSDDRRDGTENTVCVYIFDDCKNDIPEITI